MNAPFQTGRPGASGRGNWSCGGPCWLSLPWRACAIRASVNSRADEGRSCGRSCPWSKGRSPSTKPQPSTNCPCRQTFPRQVDLLRRCHLCDAESLENDVVPLRSIRETCFAGVPGKSRLMGICDSFESGAAVPVASTLLADRWGEGHRQRAPKPLTEHYPERLIGSR